MSAESVRQPTTVGDVEPATVERPRLPVPALKLEGVVPSAFSTADDNKAPDISILGKLPVPLLIHSGDDASLRQRGIPQPDRL